MAFHASGLTGEMMWSHTSGLAVIGAENGVVGRGKNRVEQGVDRVINTSGSRKQQDLKNGVKGPKNKIKGTLSGCGLVE